MNQETLQKAGWELEVVKRFTEANPRPAHIYKLTRDGVHIHIKKIRRRGWEAKVWCDTNHEPRFCAFAVDKCDSRDEAIAGLSEVHVALLRGRLAGRILAEGSIPFAKFALTVPT